MALIRKEDLLEEFKKWKEQLGGGEEEEFVKVILKAVIDKIEVQPTVKAIPVIGEWIPCSERLPEDGEDVLVWFEYFRYGSYNRLFQTHGLSYTYDGKWSGFVNGQSGWHKLSIIAWMPLPEPYMEKSR